MATVHVRWAKEHLFVASDLRGYKFNISSSVDEQAGRIGARASDLLLISAAGCSAWDVVEIMEKQRQPLRDLQVSCTGE